MKWTAISLSALLASGVACSPSTTATKTPEAPESSSARPQPKLHAPDWLPVQAREMLASRMQRHGEEMMYLTAMVLTVNYEGAAHLAQHIAEEPRIPRPTSGEQGTISQLLPERFFQLQDELNERAKSMAAAAREQEEGKMIAAYSRLTETCVSCHVLYMRDDEEGERPKEGSFDLEPEELESDSEVE
jgi:hypothetical protein